MMLQKKSIPIFTHRLPFLEIQRINDTATGLSVNIGKISDIFIFFSITHTIIDNK